MLYKIVDDWLISRVFQPACERLATLARKLPAKFILRRALSTPYAAAEFLFTGTFVFALLNAAMILSFDLGAFNYVTSIALALCGLLRSRNTVDLELGLLCPHVEREHNILMRMAGVLGTVGMLLVAAFGTHPLWVLTPSLGALATWTAGLHLMCCRKQPGTGLDNVIAFDDDDHFDPFDGGLAA